MFPWKPQYSYFISKGYIEACEHLNIFSFSQKLAPTWDALAKALEHDTAVTIAKVDCTLHRSVCNNFDIKGYPTLLWIEDGREVSADYMSCI
jgi:thioredoxin domain-containing protein 5